MVFSAPPQIHKIATLVPSATRLAALIPGTTAFLHPLHLELDSALPIRQPQLRVIRTSALVASTPKATVVEIPSRAHRFLPAAVV